MSRWRKQGSRLGKQSTITSIRDLSRRFVRRPQQIHRSHSPCPSGHHSEHQLRMDCQEESISLPHFPLILLDMLFLEAHYFRSFGKRGAMTSHSRSFLMSITAPTAIL